MSHKVNNKSINYYTVTWKLYVEPEDSRTGNMKDESEAKELTDEERRRPNVSLKGILGVLVSCCRSTRMNPAPEPVSNEFPSGVACPPR